jgi:hypothetical protein
VAAALDIFVESRRRFLNTPVYKLRHMLKGLDAAGLEWRVIDRPNAALSDRAPAAFFHLDLSDLPTEFVHAAGYYDRTINGEAYSIRKSLYADGLLARDSNHAGPVIVKTDLNFRGIPEERYKWQRSWKGVARHIVKKAVDRNYIEKKCPGYVIYERIEDVPEAVWSNRKLIVEKFHPVSLTPPIVKHRYDFFQGGGILTRTTFSTVMCEAESVTDIQLEDKPPQKITDLIERLGLDYGAIDYFENEDGVHVIDANKTVGLTDSWIEEFDFVAEHARDVTGKLVSFVRGE